MQLIHNTKTKDLCQPPRLLADLPVSLMSLTGFFFYRKLFDSDMKRTSSVENSQSFPLIYTFVRRKFPITFPDGTQGLKFINTSPKMITSIEQLWNIQANRQKEDVLPLPTVASSHLIQTPRRSLQSPGRRTHTRHSPLSCLLQSQDPAIIIIDNRENRKKKMKEKLHFVLLENNWYYSCQLVSSKE